MSNTMMRLGLFGLLAGALVIGVAGSVSAQEDEYQRYLEARDITRDLERTESVSGDANRLFSWFGQKTGFLYNYGGFLSSAYTEGNDNDRSGNAADHEHTWDYEMQNFIALDDRQNNMKLYGRIKTTYKEKRTFSRATNDHDAEQFKLDMLYLEKNYNPGKKDGFKHTLKFGRQFTQFANGIAFSKTADGITYKAARGKSTYDVMLLQARRSESNIDSRAPGNGNTDRMFWGAQFQHTFNPKIKTTLYFIGNHDNNPTYLHKDGANIQRFNLDSQFYGIGFSGAMVKGMNYFASFIKEKGTTYPNGGSDTVPQVDVDAGAVYLGLRYFMKHTLSPSFAVEYLKASGDADRTGNVNSSAGGSKEGEDRAFRGFGGLSMGYALSPTLSNIRIWKYKAALKPFAASNNRLWQDMTWESSFYQYSKHEGRGATSDSNIGTGSGTSRDIGNELDFTVAWKMLSDLRYEFRYGVFRPGSAYGGARADEQYMKLKISVDI